jgi:hypothetical protein
MLVAKIALGFASTIAVAGVYTLHQGLIRVDVDEYRPGGDHVHLWIPAAAVPVAMHLVPRSQIHLDDHCRELRDALPIVRVAIQGLKKYPSTTFVEVQDGDQHVLVSTQNGKLRVDVTDPSESAHVLVPLSTIQDVFEQVKVWSEESGSPM